jgi:hypothetical protein
MDAMQRSELTRLLPKDGRDVENARALIALGYPAIEPVLPSLFQWLETSGSEVELVVRPFFAALGEPALDLVRSALESPIKPARKAALLRYVLPSWPREAVAKLEPQLLSYLDGYDFHGLDAWALKLLMQKGLAEDQRLERWRQLKIERLKEQLEALES